MNIDKIYKSIIDRLEQDYILVKRDRERIAGPTEYVQQFPSITKEDAVLWLNNILYFLSEHLSVSISDIRSLSREKDVVRARQLYFYIARNSGINISTGTIGTLVNRDHATVLFGARKIKDLMTVYPSEKRSIESIISNYTEYEARKQSERGLEKPVAGA